MISKQNLQVALFIVLCGLGYAYYEYRQFNQREVLQMKAQQNGLKAQLANKKGSLKQLQDFSANIEKIKQELKALNLQLESALEYMPPTFDLSGMLRQLTSLAQNSGLKLSSFKPVTSTSASEGFYESVLIDFQLEGPFAQTVAFVDQLTRLKRIVNVERLDISLKDVRRPEIGVSEVITQAKLKTYRFAK